MKQFYTKPDFQISLLSKNDVLNASNDGYLENTGTVGDVLGGAGWERN